MIVKYITECKVCYGYNLREFLENKTKLIDTGFEPYKEIQKHCQIDSNLETGQQKEYMVFFQIFVKTIEKEAN